MPLDQNGMMIDVSRLFGKDRAQEDENLRSYFVKTKDYFTIATGEKELVLGRKGSGKSALYSVLQKELKSEGYKTIGISPRGEDFVIINERISKYEDLQIDNDFKYALVWKNFILTELALEIVHNTKADPANPLAKYLREEGRLEKGFVEKFISSLIKVFGKGKINFDFIEIDFDFTGTSNDFKGEYHSIINYIHQVLSKEKYFILFDNLDEPWTNTITMNAWLRGLILAIRQLKRDHSNLKLVVFLRDDIFEEISKGSDLFDSRSEILTINWRDRDYFSLKKLMAARIAAYYKYEPPDQLPEIEKLWKTFFPDTLYYPVRNYNKIVPTIKYITDRTFFRPREFLQYCRLGVEKSKNRLLPIERDVFLKVEPEYCDWKLKDLVGEYSKTYSGIDDCIFSFAGATVNWTLSYQEISDHLSVLDQESKIYNKTEKRYLEGDELIKFLYRIGFIRRMKEGYGGKRFYITYIDEANMNPKISGFDIHPAFRRKLIKM